MIKIVYENEEWDGSKQLTDRLYKQNEYNLNRLNPEFIEQTESFGEYSKIPNISKPIWFEANLPEVSSKKDGYSNNIYTIRIFGYDNNSDDIFIEISDKEGAIKPLLKHVPSCDEDNVRNFVNFANICVNEIKSILSHYKNRYGWNAKQQREKEIRKELKTNLSQYFVNSRCELNKLHVYPESNFK